MNEKLERFICESTKLHQDILVEQIKVCEDFNKYSTWFLGLSTAAAGLLITRFDDIVKNSWVGHDCIKPALIIVGSLMIQTIKNVRWDDFSEGIPAFLTIISQFHRFSDSVITLLIMPHDTKLSH